MSGRLGSFGAKVVASVTLTAGFAVVVVSSLLVLADHRVARREMHTRLGAQAAMVALDSGAPLLFGDRAHGQEVLNALRAASTIASAALFDRQGALFAGYRRSSEPGPDLQPAPSGSREEGRWLVLSVPVVDRGEAQGQLVLRSDLRPLRTRLWRGIGMASLVAGAAMLLAFLVARRIAAGLTVQIDELVTTATRVSETRDSRLRAAKLSDDELGGLALNFNEMLSRIEDQRRELAEADAGRQDLLESERAARAEAERASRMKDDFVATLSHELRTPLMPILGWVAILRQSPPSHEQLLEVLDVIERNARLQTQLIEDLLEMSRITSGKLRLDVQPVDLAEVVEAALTTVGPAAEAREIKVTRLLDPDVGPVRGDPSRLQQVIWNLLSNAIKFTPKGGSVQVSLARVNSHVEIEVADNGQGIPPDLLPHVFERFRQADSTATRRHGGLGLGLAIVRELVELHGGAVRADSPGTNRGAVFTVSLPLMPVQAERPGERREHPTASFEPLAGEPPPGLGGLAVLVVDDDGDARELLRRVLEQGGAAVRLAGSANAALEEYGSAPPDLLISDIGMPDVDGYELIRRVREIDRERNSATPAIALTAFARTEDRTRALRAGYQMHIAKPVDPSELLAAVATLSGRT